MAPTNAHAAPTTQIHSTRAGEPSWPARNPVVVQIPVPIMFDTTSAIALTTPSCLRSAGLDEATSDPILLPLLPVALLVLLPAAARARIVAPDLGRRGRRLRL